MGSSRRCTASLHLTQHGVQRRLLSGYGNDRTLLRGVFANRDRNITCRRPDDKNAMEITHSFQSVRLSTETGRRVPLRYLFLDWSRPLYRGQNSTRCRINDTTQVVPGFLSSSHCQLNIFREACRSKIVFRPTRPTIEWCSRAKQNTLYYRANGWFVTCGDQPAISPYPAVSSVCLQRVETDVQDKAWSHIFSRAVFWENKVNILPGSINSSLAEWDR